MIMWSQQDGSEFLKLARETVKNYFEDSRLKIKKTRFNERQGVFVTINSVSNELRGCIGYPYPTYSLGEAIQRAAVSTAFEDPRFPPLTRQGLDQIIFEISVLTKLELIEVENPREYLKKIEIGKDGLIIECGFNKGLLLPQVAADYDWNVEEFIQHTCYKAGLPPDMWMDERVKIYKFQAQIF
ncbi:MAG: TIGR00296 family protein, partial [Candidatus Aenigmarchaeota archaeon]|nr:TIGR00296 family protein [Candidatus Aenigmarchaeota archaeon]